MSEFSAEWLDLREPFDAASRSTRLTTAVAGALPRDRTLSILDLGSGAGANARYLTDKLPQPQQWLLIDRDQRLLDRAPKEWPALCVDLQQAVLDSSLFAGRALVTASALLDLVSEDWLHALVGRCREAAATVLFALTYDGRVDCAPAEPEDEAVIGLVNRHQRTDKGFGPALGPSATAKAEALFKAAGYNTDREASDWELTPESRDLQSQLIAGWADAATAVSPDLSATIADWRARRIEHVNAGRSQLIVGHMDLAGWLPK